MFTTSAPYGAQVEYISDDLVVSYTTVREILPFTRAVRDTHFRVSCQWCDASRRRKVTQVLRFEPVSGLWSESTYEAKQKLLDQSSTCEWNRIDRPEGEKSMLWVLHHDDEVIVSRCQIAFERLLREEGVLELQDPNPGARAIGDIILRRMRFSGCMNAVLRLTTVAVLLELCQ
jgi:hypothetical protein